MKKWFFIFILLISALIYPLQSIKAEKADILEWEKRAELPAARVGAVSEVYDGKIYVIGGIGSGKANSNTTYVYDPKLDKWSEKASMKTGRMGAASVIVGDHIYVMGGRTDQGFSNSVEVYNIKMDKWEEAEDLPFELKISAFDLYAGAIDNKIYVLGYNKPLKHENYSSNTYSYDIKTKEWTKKKKFEKDAPAGNAVVIKNKLYVLSGQATFEYDPSIDQWTSVGSGGIGRYYSALNFEDYIIRTGGVSKVTLYDKQTKTSRTVPNSSAPYRMGHVSAIIDDTLYVIGGIPQSNDAPNYARDDFKSNLSISLKSLKNSDTTAPPGDKDPDPATPPKDDSTNPGDKDSDPATPPKDGATDEDGDALLIITMVNGLQKEYDLSMKEVNAYLSWYKKRDAGEGPGFYEIDEHDNNKGPFESKKDYVVFKNILMFEVNKYKK
ncbi:Kelch repeat-containing protein [Bacillus pumilus]|uniref:Kelch repeat-containing protein n=1 Tax=Bacillus pumilus TaxID=1408 RepID=UPI00285E98FD|nr:N-acetylneuraminic acid mutarotase [Bacillus pumilus]